MPGKIAHTMGFTFNKQHYETPKIQMQMPRKFPLAPTPVSQGRGVMDASKSDADFVYLSTDFIKSKKVPCSYNFTKFKQLQKESLKKF